MVFPFLDKYCQTIPDLVAVVRLFTLMYTICGILASGAEEPVKHTNLLRRLMEEYHEIHVLLINLEGGEEFGGHLKDLR